MNNPVLRISPIEYSGNHAARTFNLPKLALAGLASIVFHGVCATGFTMAVQNVDTVHVSNSIQATLVHEVQSSNLPAEKISMQDSKPAAQPKDLSIPSVFPAELLTHDKSYTASKTDYEAEIQKTLYEFNWGDDSDNDSTEESEVAIDSKDFAEATPVSKEFDTLADAETTGEAAASQESVFDIESETTLHVAYFGVSEENQIEPSAPPPAGEENKITKEESTKEITPLLVPEQKPVRQTTQSDLEKETEISLSAQPASNASNKLQTHPTQLETIQLEDGNKNLSSGPLEQVASMQPSRTAPAYGIEGFSNPAPQYPYLSRVNSEEGKVVLRVHVNQKGKVAKIETYKSSGYRRLDKAATTAVRRWQFKPAQIDGRPAKGIVNVPISFVLSN